MGKLHDCLKEIGYMGHDLEVYLVRLLFCLFADDTGIFNKGIFWEYIDLHTKEDGSDLAMHIDAIFQVLNKPEEKRLKNLDENLTQFPYINGKLFEESLPMAAFDSKMRVMLLEACAFDWGKISPAIFGSMFQAVMNPKERRNLGAHYTSEKNIQKVIKPLFLDDLHREFEKIKGNRNKLLEFQKKIANLYFLDPACGCGNFLIITYRELRDLEILVLQELDKTGQLVTDISTIIQVDVNQFAGIEYDEFAVRGAEVAMWLIDHQMNVKVSNTFGQYFVRLPLKKAAKIVHGNALRIDWEEVISKEDLNFILGNPPFVGHHYQTLDQKEDLKLVLDKITGSGVMDYVSAWFYKSAQFIQDTTIKVGLVSTNSISQGEQSSILWNVLINEFNISIHFAHRTFKWSNEAKGNAAVHCVIIGFASFEANEKYLFDYQTITSEPLLIKAKNINPYLINANNILVFNRKYPLCNVPNMMYGNKPTDGGNFILSEEEKNTLVLKNPLVIKFIKPFISAREFLNGGKKWCLWLLDIKPNELKNIPEILERVEAVKQFRSKSIAASTQNYSYHCLFRQITQPKSDYILVPRTTSENRKYIPIGFFTADNIVSDTCQSIPNGDLYLFGILTSAMHMAWVKYVCGRLKSDYRYSKDIVYNNYPFPENITDKQKQTVETCAQAVLDTRVKYPDSSLADLYDPLTMPPDLLKAHQKLDKAVDLCYRPQPFTSELNRIEYLFELYEKLTAPLLPTSKQKPAKRKNPQ
ncbi:class I SAM-dependent DNA methyltransferase [Microcystis aeruginosa CS-567/02]|nr:DNA methyltransferase [Microcystis aeruginosa]MDB9411273.1 class I SAM-dependent DNA methyltransferase [Microcystis aeruginosa CS-567/02]